MHAVLFKIGSFELRYYSLMYVLAMSLSYILLKREVSRKKIPLTNNEILNLILLSVTGGIIGARLYYIAFNWEYFSSHFGEIFDIKRGGLASHGGFIAGFIVGYSYLRYRKVSAWRIADSIFPMIILGEACVRFGNFMNGEAHGQPTTLPWGLVFPSGSPAGNQFPNTPVHPTMLYHMFYDLIIFLLIWFGFRKRNFRNGFISAVTLLLYSIGRFFIESLRADSLYFGKYRIAQIMSVMLITIMAYIITRKRLWIRDG
jgi:phosphatidylglycerol:prolipoprotein diacylglycerol transferase